MQSIIVLLYRIYSNRSRRLLLEQPGSQTRHRDSANCTASNFNFKVQLFRFLNFLMPLGVVGRRQKKFTPFWGSLDFSFNRLLMKLFKTTNTSIINDCRLYFGTKPPSELLLKRREKFLDAYNSSEQFSLQNVRLMLSISKFS